MPKGLRTTSLKTSRSNGSPNNARQYARHVRKSKNTLSINLSVNTGARCVSVPLRQKCEASKSNARIPTEQDGRQLNFQQRLFRIFLKNNLNVECKAEYRFHPKRRWRFDYAIPEHKIAIEVEGGVWTNGRHTRGKGYINDMEKYNEAVIGGWRLIRVTPDQLITTYTLKAVNSIIAND